MWHFNYKKISRGGMKNIYWISSSKEDLLELPAEVMRFFWTWTARSSKMRKT